MNQALGTSLSDICDLAVDPVDPRKAPSLPYLGLEHLSPGRFEPTGYGKAADVSSSKHLFRKGDVLYGKLRPYLDKAVLADRDGLGTTELLVLRPRQHVDPHFLLGVVHSPDFVEHAMAGVRGVQHPRTSWPHLRLFEVPEMAPQEQARIGQLVWSVQRAIAACEASVESAEALKRAAMRELFTRGPRGAGQKESEIGPIPATWTPTPFTELREWLQYGTSERCHKQVVGYPVLRIPNIEPGRVNPTDLKYSDMTDKEAGRYLLQPGDLLFIRTNGVIERLGACAVYAGEPERALFASYLIRARLLPMVDPRFAALFLGSEQGTQIVTSRATPAADGKFNLNTSAIDSFVIPLPPDMDEQREIVEILDVIDQKIDLHKRKKVVLEELFKALLHKLMTGEIRVSDLDLSALQTEDARS